MKKKILVIGLLAMMITVNACGENKTDKVFHETSDAEVEKEIKNENDEKISKDKNLLGVYTGEGDICEVPLGTYFKNTQKDFCKVKVPSNYWSGAIYKDENMGQNTFEMSSGADLVSDALDDGLLEQGNSVQYLLINNPELDSECTTVIFTIYTPEECNFADVKNLFENVVELKNTENQAFNYVDESDYSVTDLILYYAVNENITLEVQYEGPLAKTLGLDQVAKNLYDIIEVI